MRSEQHARVARMSRKREHPSSERGDRTRPCVNSFQVGEQQLGPFQCASVGGLEPAKFSQIVYTARFECEDHLCEIQAFHFRKFLGGSRVLLMGCPETQTVSGR